MKFEKILVKAKSVVPDRVELSIKPRELPSAKLVWENRLKRLQKRHARKRTVYIRTRDKIIAVREC